MRSLPLNSLRAYFLALRTNIFLKRESVNTKVEDDVRARREQKARRVASSSFRKRNLTRWMRCNIGKRFRLFSMCGFRFAHLE
jgi:hypothetical protein